MDPKSLQIRLGNASDLGSVEAIQNASAEAARWDVLDYLGYDFHIAEVTFPKLEVAGFAVAREVTTGEWELLNLVVAAPFRRHGVGSRLLVNLLQSGAKTVFLEVRESNHVAQKLYAHHGFRVVGIRRNYYSAPVENAIVLCFQK